MTEILYFFAILYYTSNLEYNKFKFVTKINNNEVAYFNVEFNQYMAQISFSNSSINQ